MTDKTAELRECPFCGSDKLKEEAVSNTNGNRRYIYCCSCWTFGPWSTKDMSASEKWNHRTQPPLIAEGELEKMCMATMGVHEP